MAGPDRRRRSRSGRLLDALIWGLILGAAGGAVLGAAIDGLGAGLGAVIGVAVYAPAEVLTTAKRGGAEIKPLWQRIVAKHGLRATPYADVAAWPFADYVFGCDWDVMSDTLKIRAAGFHEHVRSSEIFLRLFTQFRELQVLP